MRSPRTGRSAMGCQGGVSVDAIDWSILPRMKETVQPCGLMVYSTFPLYRIHGAVWSLRSRGRQVADLNMPS